MERTGGFLMGEEPDPHINKANINSLLDFLRVYLESNIISKYCKLFDILNFYCITSIKIVDGAFIKKKSWIALCH